MSITLLSSAYLCASQYSVEMRNVKQIEKDDEQLPPSELAEFRAWFEKFDSDRWDKKFEKDVKSGKLDDIADKAIKDFKKWTISKNMNHFAWRILLKCCGAFPDGESALMLTAARLRYVVSTKWSSKRYLNMKLLEDMEKEQMKA